VFFFLKKQRTIYEGVAVDGSVRGGTGVESNSYARWRGSFRSLIVDKL
jgi:hypothetical protein